MKGAEYKTEHRTSLQIALGSLNEGLSSISSIITIQVTLIMQKGMEGWLFPLFIFIF